MTKHEDVDRRHVGECRRPSRTLGLLLLCASMIVASACSSGGAKSSGGSGTFSLVALSDLSGSQAANEGPSVYAIRAYVDMINAKGGVDGHKITLRIGDTQTDPTAAGAAFQTAVQAQPLAILMGGISTELPVALPIAQKAGIPVVAAALPDADAYPPQSGLFYGDATSFEEAYGEVALMSSLAQKEGITDPRVALPVVVSSFGDTFVAAVKQLQSRFHYKVVGVDRTPLEATTFNADAAEIESWRPDFLVGAENPLISSVVVNALRADNITAPFIDYPQAYNPTVLKQEQDPNWYTFQFAQFPTSAGLTQLQTASKAAGVEKYEISLFYTLGWLDAELTVKALQSCGYPCSSSKLSDTLNHTTVSGEPYAFGTIGFSPENHIMLKTVQAYHWSNGSIQPAGAQVTVTATPSDPNG